MLYSMMEMIMSELRLIVVSYYLAQHNTGVEGERSGAVEGDTAGRTQHHTNTLSTHDNTNLTC